MDADYESMDLMYRASVVAIKENPVLYKGRQNIHPGYYPQSQMRHRRLGAARLHRSSLKVFLLFCPAIYASVIYHYMHAMLAHKKKCESEIKRGDIEYFVGHGTCRRLSDRP